MCIQLQLCAYENSMYTKNSILMYSDIIHHFRKIVIACYFARHTKTSTVPVVTLNVFGSKLNYNDSKIFLVKSS